MAEALPAIAGRSKGYIPFPYGSPLLNDGRFHFDIQQFTEDEDLPDVPALELTDDVAQLKATARDLHGKLTRTRTEAGKRRIQLRTVEQERDALKTEFATFKATAETEKTGLKAELETANRSNGQLKTRFKDQFVNKAVMDELEKAGAAKDAVPVILKALDLTKVEFDEESLTAKGHEAIIAEFKTATPSLFAGSKSAPRGTTANTNGNSNNGGTAGNVDGAKFDFMSEDNKKKSFTELARESALATIAGS